ncbi:hypothetical protein GPECTOR_16g613 [Gonium pectorale]|uniref:Uncharacterized protein n=1 Tax=Gonium pectorale TaxID=33097 RepID=A0A150GKQ8_GONPE|nr:hypothetical protein GPECTOR_16g613 [Gonium pectorale]|eukprot:KXZ50439.1 hypothetical protein GPECTOR_16g613 [Gonium pectorale]
MDDQGTVVPRQWTREVACPEVFIALSLDSDKVWAAAAFATSYGEHDVRLEVLRSSPFLSSLVVDSRAWAAAHIAPSLA